MAIVTFMPMNYVVKVEDGITVLKAEHLAGITQKAQCGGHGKCGKCKVWICVRHSRERWFLEIKDAIEAGAGSQMTACDEKEFLKTDELLKKIEPLKLATLPEFSRIFAKSMYFRE